MTGANGRHIGGLDVRVTHVWRAKRFCTVCPDQETTHREQTAPAAVCHAVKNHPILPTAPRVRGQGDKTTEGYNMVSIIVLAVIVLGAGGIVWRRQRHLRAYAAPVTPEGLPRETLALHAFTLGNTCLAEGKFAEASAAFHQARELDPKRPHVADRLAEVERRQQAASAMAPANATP